MRADKVVGQSRNTLDNLRRFYAPDVEAVRIPLGITRPDIGPASRQEYGFKAEDVLLVTVGRLVARKANQQLLSMMAALDIEDVRLLIMGSGPEEQALRAEAERLQLGDRVRFMGFVEESEKFRILQMCDMYVSTSQHEGFGMVFLEAMHCGLPVVCYNHGGQTDFLQDGQTGFLLELNDQESFRDRCQQLIRSPEQRSTMGKTNRRVVEDYYIDECARQYEAIFEEAIATREGRSRESQLQSTMR